MRTPFRPKDHLGFNGVWLPTADDDRDSDSAEEAEPARKELDSNLDAALVIAPPKEGGEGNPEQEQSAVETKYTEQVEPALETKPVEKEQSAFEKKFNFRILPYPPGDGILDYGVSYAQLVYRKNGDGAKFNAVGSKPVAWPSGWNEQSTYVLSRTLNVLSNYISEVPSSISDADELTSLRETVRKAKQAMQSKTEKRGVDSYNLMAMHSTIPDLETSLSSIGKEEGQAEPGSTKLQELKDNLIAAVGRWKQAEAELLPREGDALPPGYETAPTQIRVAKSAPEWFAMNTLWRVSAVRSDSGLLEHICVEDDPREADFSGGSRTLTSSTYRFGKDRTTFRLVNPEDYGPGRYLYDPLLDDDTIYASKSYVSAGNSVS